MKTTIMNELKIEKLETIYWNPEFDFGDFKEAARLEGYGYLVLFDTETPSGCACEDNVDLLDVLYDANKDKVFYMIMELQCTPEEKSFNKLGHHLERIYGQLDNFYPSNVPNKLNSLHYERTFEISKEDDCCYSIVLDFLTTSEDVVMVNLDIELDDDELIDGYYFDEYVEAHNIDLADFGEHAELEIVVDLEEKTLDFEYHYSDYSSRFRLERLASKIKEDSEFWKKLTDYIRHAFPESEVYFREEKIEQLLSS